MSVLIESHTTSYAINTNWQPISYRFKFTADYCSNLGHCVLSPRLSVLFPYIVCRISSFTFGQNWPNLQRGLSSIQ